LGTEGYLKALTPWTLCSPPSAATERHSLALNLSGLSAATALVRWREGWLLVARQPLLPGTANLYRLVYVETVDGSGMVISPPFHLGDSIAADDCHSLSVTAGGCVLTARIAGQPCLLTLSEQELASWLDQGARLANREND
jgi:hypothetical protein